MPEARIIPIKGEPAEKPSDRKPPRRGAGKPAGAGKPSRSPAAQDGQAAQDPPAPTGGGPARSDRRTPPRKRRPAAKPRPVSGPDKPEPAGEVKPPEELLDLGSFVTDARTEPPAKPAQRPKPEQVNGQVWPDRSAAAGPDRPEPPPTGVPADPWERKVASALAFVRRRLTGEYEVDEFGFDPELASTVLAAPLRPLYEKWFRVEVSGMENVPDTGGALIVANHSGTIALDGLITALSLLDHHPARRHLRMLGADLVFKTPFLGEFARKAGNTLACNADAERLLSSGELVGVYPEGFKGVGKPFSERYKLQRFGRGGFVSAALRTKAPIIPCSIVGAEEIYPLLGNAKVLARLLGLPYFPLTPTFPWLGPLGMIPLPSKWYIEFGEPIETVSMADQVRETIQQTLYRLLMKRKSVFS
jgi:1-acyl-sn-glycerol-3-phosphate acyltransferase